MIVKKYEIDMLNVGAADACLIHFFDEAGNSYVVLIDAGNYTDGKTVSNFIQTRYGTKTVDLAICSHCDKDHFGGLVYLLEDMADRPFSSVKIKKLWVNDPGKHVNVDDVKYYRNQQNAEKEARSVYTLPNGKNLFEVLSKVNVTVSEAFSDTTFVDFDGHIEVLGPTKTYYEAKSLLFRNGLEPVVKTYSGIDRLEDSDENGDVKSKALDEANDDSSAHNQTSILVLFTPDDGNKFYFPGDAGREAYDNMYSVDKDKIKDITWLKVPHHGSRGNMNCAMINWMNPTYAFVSCEGYDKWLDSLIVRVLKRKGCSVASTHVSGNMRYHIGVDSRPDYSPLSYL